MADWDDVGKRESGMRRRKQRRTLSARPMMTYTHSVDLVLAPDAVMKRLYRGDLSDRWRLGNDGGYTYLAPEGSRMGFRSSVATAEPQISVNAIPDGTRLTIAVTIITSRGGYLLQPWIRHRSRVGCLAVVLVVDPGYRDPVDHRRRTAARWMLRGSLLLLAIVLPLSGAFNGWPPLHNLVASGGFGRPAITLILGATVLSAVALWWLVRSALAIVRRFRSHITTRRTGAPEMTIMKSRHGRSPRDEHTPTHPPPT